ncbi:hypothetical protein P7K49_020533 [Saguinus oedipus]|uniref:Uncharacterized protein n=1 Tax=Saguinus oedipus TaxID=9490 RepID=A0ABQ9V0J6_SAGOE|nr:hypothetical protein P7K49_020533 [Saguinus oedipus]
MDDLRVLWMRDRVYAAFGITDPQLFEDLLNRDDGQGEDLILHFLNQASEEEGSSALLFYRTVVPEEVEVETGEPRRAARFPGLPPCPPRPLRRAWGLRSLPITRPRPQVLSINTAARHVQAPGEPGNL